MHSNNGHATVKRTPKHIRVRVLRQEGPESLPFWEEYELPYKKGHNVVSLLMEIRKNPITIEGKSAAQISWEANCLEQVCGACSMVINGEPRQACAALVDDLEQPITIEPMTKFPVVRDLAIDRSRMFNNLKRVKAWVDVDGFYPLGPGPKIPADLALKRYDLSTCMTCGVCLQVCPQFSKDNDFVGAQTISQVRLFNLHPSAESESEDRLEALMAEGGIADCGNAQLCVKACPKHIPLTESIAEVGREVTKHTIKKFIGI